MKFLQSLFLIGLGMAVWLSPPSAEADGDLIRLQSEEAEAACTLEGGALVLFRLRGETLNPINWEVPDDVLEKPLGSAMPRGQFLCLDRWGAPSTEESRHGMPFHGEAAHRRWKSVEPPGPGKGLQQATITCDLPLAGLAVTRTIELDPQRAALLVSDLVIHRGTLGRIYNIVQHPTIAPPFLDSGTLVDSNAAAGFEQDTPPINGIGQPWPRIRLRGEVVDLRRFEPDSALETKSDVCSFVFPEGSRLGWVTACNPARRLLLGYVWRTGEYPWLNVWRYRRGEQLLARGLEFGTTGLHQPFSTQVRTGPILGRATYVFLDAGEEQRRTYLMFLARIPEGFTGVSDLQIERGGLRLTESAGGGQVQISVPTALCSRLLD